MVVSNRFPNDVFMEEGSFYGRWTVPRLQWKAAPQSVQRQDFNTLLVTFEPEERVGGMARNANALNNVPHTFVVEGVTVLNEKPRRVVTVRGGRLCPCYGVWVVTKALSNCFCVCTKAFALGSGTMVHTTIQNAPKKMDGSQPDCC